MFISRPVEPCRSFARRRRKLARSRAPACAGFVGTDVGRLWAARLSMGAAVPGAIKAIEQRQAANGTRRIFFLKCPDISGVKAATTRCRIGPEKSCLRSKRLGKVELPLAGGFSPLSERFST